MKVNDQIEAKVAPKQITLEAEEGKIELDDMGPMFRFLIQQENVRASVVEEHGSLEIAVSAEEAKAFAEAILWFLEERGR